MKQTELSEVYCRPKNEDEWRMVGLSIPETWDIELYPEMEFVQATLEDEHCYYGTQISAREIPIEQFIDLLEDRIVPWRLEEIGFKLDHLGDILELHVNGWALSVDNDSSIWLTYGDSGTIINISTFTELLQLLKFLNYEVK